MVRIEGEGMGGGVSQTMREEMRYGESNAGGKNKKGTK
jgi:hypothetical protein